MFLLLLKDLFYIEPFCFCGMSVDLFWYLCGGVLCKYDYSLGTKICWVVSIFCTQAAGCKWPPHLLNYCDSKWELEKSLYQVYYMNTRSINQWTQILVNSIKEWTRRLVNSVCNIELYSLFHAYLHMQEFFVSILILVPSSSQDKMHKF